MNNRRTTSEYAFNPAYERNQSFNPLVSWLHSQRYRHVIDAISPVVPADRPLQVLDLGCGFARLYAVIRDGHHFGMNTMNQSLEKLYQSKLIGYDDAIANAGNVTELRQMLRRS